MDYEPKLKTSLQTIFNGTNYLNWKQKEAVENVIQRKSDIFVCGYGKSLCYQLPVMVKDNSFIIVITPRVPYIKKYTNHFSSKNITTNYLTARSCRKQRNLIEKDIVSKNSKMKILFITPLQYETAYFKTILKKIDKKRLFGIVIDQADNISSKQENLCNQYQNLDLKIIRVPIITIMSMANSRVQKDVIKSFGLVNPKVYDMSIVLANLYCDVKYINIMHDPMQNLTHFIKGCLYTENHAHSAKEENWGIIICKDGESTTSLAKSLTCAGIPVLPCDTCSDQVKRSNNTNLKNVKDAKVILECEKDDTLSVTNRLVQVKAPKPLKFIVFWQVVPNIEKYYLLSSRVQCVYRPSFCRVYCKIDKMNYNWTNSSSHNNELSTAILSGLIKMQCRHKAYSDFYGNIFTACEIRCDVCCHKKKVENEIMQLMKIIEKLDLRVKLNQILLKSRQDSNKKYDEQLKLTKQKVSNHKTEGKINTRVEKEDRDDHSSLNKNLAYDKEVTCKNHVEIDKKRKAESDLRDIYEKQWGKRIKKTHFDKSETFQRVIVYHHQYYPKKNSKSDGNNNSIDKVSSSSEPLYSEQHKSSSKNSQEREKKIIEIDISDTSDEDDEDDEVAFLKETPISNTNKRHRSDDQNRESYKQAKRSNLS